MKAKSSFLKILFIITIVLSGCNIKTEEDRLILIKNEILRVEKNFADMAKTTGVKEAFLNYAADDAVISRNDSLILGRERIKSYFESQTLTNVKLEWMPDFVDVSLSGDMAYTYGRYRFSALNDKGKEVLKEGTFHTVWKRQKDGSWKYVFD